MTTGTKDCRPGCPHGMEKMGEGIYRCSECGRYKGECDCPVPITWFVQHDPPTRRLMVGDGAFKLYPNGDGSIRVESDGGCIADLNPDGTIDLVS